MMQPGLRAPTLSKEAGNYVKRISKYKAIIFIVFDKVLWEIIEESDNLSVPAIVRTRERRTFGDRTGFRLSLFTGNLYHLFNHLTFCCVHQKTGNSNTYLLSFVLVNT